MEKKVANRWVVLVASMICNLLIGSAYAWSVFQGPIIETFGWLPSQVSLTFTLILGMMPIAMFISGYLQDKWGSTLTMVLGGALFGLGVFLASFTKSLGFLLLTHGFIAGLGVGTVYSCAVAAAKWFPDKRGLASGLVAAGLGMGAFFFAPIGNSLIQTYNVLTAFKILGIVHLICIIGCAFLVKDPPAGYKPKGWEPPEVTGAQTSSLDKSPKEMLSDGMFWLLWVLFILGAVAGLMIIGHASPIGQKVIGLTVAEAATAVSILAIANTGGRVFWGTISDKVGRYRTLTALYIVSSLSMFYMTTISTYVSYIIAICLAALCFGGLLGIFPTVIADLYGTKYHSQNFGILFSAFAVASIIGPTLAAKVVEASGGYNLAFIVAAVMGVIGVVLTLFVQNQLKKSTISETTISS